ncbi:DinB family protein [Kutzneria chonburiensis]|uniref:DinB family protein n=1 Tax=Kutzneria chonburiensis TaxID=1483604 RepID=A0ABV6N6J7_9PSEU|nr:DinB family protein [Kutzneria chonburiensis]
MTETTDLLAVLAAARSALLKTADGLSDEQAAERPTASSLCIGGLLKHVMAMEEQWLRFAVEGASAMPHELPDSVTWDDIMTGAAPPPQWMVDHQNAFQMLPGDTLADIRARYEKVAARTVEIAATADLDAGQALPPAPWLEPGGSYTVRRVIMHVATETAQHAGHADILRESLGG